MKIFAADPFWNHRCHLKAFLNFDMMGWPFFLAWSTVKEICVDQQVQPIFMNERKTS